MHIFMHVGEDAWDPRGRQQRTATTVNQVGQLRASVVTVMESGYFYKVKGSVVEQQVFKMFF